MSGIFIRSQGLEIRCEERLQEMGSVRIIRASYEITGAWYAHEGVEEKQNEENFLEGLRGS